jgi:hypothetical protein
MSNALFTNENYTVLPSSELDYYDENGNCYEANYIVVNRATGHVELITPQLASALFAAAEFNHVLEEKPYLWRDRSGDLGDVLLKSMEGKNDEPDSTH